MRALLLCGFVFAGVASYAACGGDSGNTPQGDADATTDGASIDDSSNVSDGALPPEDGESAFDGAITDGGIGDAKMSDAKAADADAGIDTSLCPFDPKTKAAVCPPYTKPAVFFIPHQDDETIGMAAAIAEHVKAGRQVFLELMTDGQSSKTRLQLDDGKTDALHAGAHVYALTTKQFSDARVLEFTDAAMRLGVTGIRLNGIKDGTLAAADVKTRIDWWRVKSDKTLSLKGTASGDASYTHHDSPPGHPDHNAIWDALVASKYDDVRGYLVYVNASGAAAATPNQTIDLGTAECAAKTSVATAYKLWQPASSRYAIGYHSVGDLFANATTKCKEYVVLPPP